MKLNFRFQLIKCYKSKSPNYNFSSKIYTNMSYWDIDHFLAEEQKIHCEFTKQATGMQFIDTTKGHGGNIEANTQFEIPIWIINVINDYMPDLQETKCFKVKFPEYLHSKEFKNRVKSFEIAVRNSSMEKVNLDQESTYLYETYLLAIKIMTHQGTDFDKGIISELLRNRGKYILIRASNYVGNVNIDTMLNTYTDFESKIYRITKRIMQDCSAWKYAHSWLNKYNSLKKTITK